jgi:hypothetical protein
MLPNSRLMGILCLKGTLSQRVLSFSTEKATRSPKITVMNFSRINFPLITVCKSPFTIKATCGAKTLRSLIAISKIRKVRAREATLQTTPNSCHLMTTSALLSHQWCNIDNHTSLMDINSYKTLSLRSSLLMRGALISLRMSPGKAVI